MSQFPIRTTLDGVAQCARDGYTTFSKEIENLLSTYESRSSQLELPLIVLLESVLTDTCSCILSRTVDYLLAVYVPEDVTLTVVSNGAMIYRCEGNSETIPDSGTYVRRVPVSPVLPISALAWNDIEFTFSKRCRVFFEVLAVPDYTISQKLSYLYSESYSNGVGRLLRVSDVPLLGISNSDTPTQTPIDVQRTTYDELYKRCDSILKLAQTEAETVDTPPKWSVLGLLKCLFTKSGSTYTYVDRRDVTYNGQTTDCGQTV